MMLTIYLFANVGVILFRTNDPFHWGSLHVAAITLFRMSTLEDWTDIMYINSTAARLELTQPRALSTCLRLSPA